MAWFSNLADKAENLLNRIDQNVSVVLLQNESTDTEKHTSETETFFENPEGDPIEVIVDPSDLDSDSIEKQSLRSSASEISMFELAAQMFAENDGIYKQNADMLMNDSQSDNKMFESTSSSMSMCNDKENELLANVQQRNAELEAKCSSLLERIIKLEKSLASSEHTNAKLMQDYKQTFTTLSNTRQEMEKYRSQSQKYLQDKERLLKLRENISIKTADHEDHQIEHISKLVKVRDDQEKEINILNEKLEIIQNDLTSVQKQCALYEFKSFEAIQNVQEEHKIRLSLEEDLYNVRQELQKTLNTLEQKYQLVDLKDMEIEKLRNELQERSFVIENDELKSKFHVLTQTLISKQKSVETLTTERNALRLQLEKIENDYKRMSMQLKRNQANILITDDEKLHMNEQRTKKVFTFDTFLNRLFSYMRRYPVARAFLLFYMAILQIWIVILFSYILSNH